MEAGARALLCVALLMGLFTILPTAPVRAAPAPSPGPEIIVAANIYKPFAFVQDGQLVGFDVDLVNLIASLNGWNVHYETMTFSDELAGIRNESIDLGIGSIFKTSDRASHFAFTDAYMDSGLVLITPADSTLHSPRDLGSHRVAVKAGTASDDFVVGLDTRYGQIDVQRYVSADEVIAAVASGRADAAVHDYINAQYLVNEHYLGTLVLQKGSFLKPFLAGRQPVAYVAARKILPLLPQFNATLAELRSNGMLAQLETKWFGSTISFYTSRNWLRTVVPMVAAAAILLVAAYLLVSRERAAREARERAAHYQQLFAAVPEPALLVSDAGGSLEVEAVNGALCTLLGRQESDLIGVAVESFMISGKDTTPKTLRCLEDVRTASPGWQFVTSDGTLIPVELTTSTLQTPKKQVLIIARDLREQLKAQQTIRAAYEQYHSLFDEAPDPTFIISNHLIVQINHAATRTLGMTLEELIGRTIASISPALQPDGRSSAQAMQDMEDRALAGNVQRFDWVLVGKDGHQVICEASLQSLPSAGPAVLQGIFHDVTERRLMEERSQQLERELLQSQKMEAVGRLAGGIAHDFNNIIGGIIGYASLLRVDAPEGTELYEGLNTIEFAARRAARLTQRLLSFSRKGGSTTTDVDVAGVLRDALALAMPGFDQHTVVVQNIAPDLDYVLGDRTQLEEVFLNIIINARDAVKPRGGTLTVNACNVSIDESFYASHAIPVLPDGSYVQITVTDTGCGLTPEAMDHLFEPFFTTKPEGTGLGLSIVWRVVHDHKGTIAVASEPSKGTSFTVYLPATSRAEAMKRVPQTSVSGSLPRSSGEETVLIVDDEDVVRSVAVKVLSGLGYHVIDTGNPLNAIAIYKESWHSIDLVLVDMMMPHMNGKELLEQLHTINPSVAAILMSGYDATDTPFESMGFVAFIPKPYTLQELASRVRQSLDTLVEASTSTTQSPAT
ncbi:transporter substrate-binding domain-containing protein [bacterium]|nr:transporter substrate-binding domain-containing protein [bacterium]